MPFYFKTGGSRNAQVQLCQLCQLGSPQLQLANGSWPTGNCEAVILFSSATKTVKFTNFANCESSNLQLATGSWPTGNW
jgi:hypothetical protein